MDRVRDLGGWRGPRLERVAVHPNGVDGLEPLELVEHQLLDTQKLSVDAL
jgi:hypothetical protein